MKLTCKACGAVWNDPQLATQPLHDWLIVSRAVIAAGCQHCGATGDNILLAPVQTLGLREGNDNAETLR